jgi:hypothetical protein
MFVVVERNQEGEVMVRVVVCGKVVLVGRPEWVWWERGTWGM